jgi:hypothetical protein
MLAQRQALWLIHVSPETGTRSLGNGDQSQLVSQHEFLLSTQDLQGFTSRIQLMELQKLEGLPTNPQHLVLSLAAGDKKVLCSLQKLASAQPSDPATSSPPSSRAVGLRVPQPSL